MENYLEEQSFEVLGHRVRFRRGEHLSEHAAEAVERLSREANTFLKTSPQMGPEKALLLSALKLSLELVSAEKEYQEGLEKYQTTAEECLRMIEDIIPKTH